VSIRAPDFYILRLLQTTTCSNTIFPILYTGVYKVWTLKILTQLYSHINVSCFTAFHLAQSNCQLKTTDVITSRILPWLRLTDTIDFSYIDLCNKLTPFVWKNVKNYSLTLKLVWWEQFREYSNVPNILKRVSYYYLPILYYGKIERIQDYTIGNLCKHK